MTDYEKVCALIRNERLPAGTVVKIGEGAFGTVFSVAAKPIYVVKLFKIRGMAALEAVSLGEMAKLDCVKVPKVLGLYKSIEGEFIAMDYLAGTPMNAIRLDRSARARAAREIASAVAGFLTDPGGYGVIGAADYEEWCDFYREKSKNLLQKAVKLQSCGGLGEKTLAVMRRAYAGFDRIFKDQPIRRAFVHGDLNPENVMLRQDGGLSGFYDPIGSFYGDSEYELFQLETNGGKRYPVLKEYWKIVEKSPRYEIKRDFYRLFAEVGYYYDANLSETPLLRRWAASLNRNLKRFRIAGAI